MQILSLRLHFANRERPAWKHIGTMLSAHNPWELLVTA